MKPVDTRGQIWAAARALSSPAMAEELAAAEQAAEVRGAVHPSYCYAIMAFCTAAGHLAAEDLAAEPPPRGAVAAVYEYLLRRLSEINYDLAEEVIAWLVKLHLLGVRARWKIAYIDGLGGLLRDGGGPEAVAAMAASTEGRPIVEDGESWWRPDDHVWGMILAAAEGHDIGLLTLRVCDQAPGFGTWNM